MVCVVLFCPLFWTLNEMLYLCSNFLKIKCIEAFPCIIAHCHLPCGSNTMWFKYIFFNHNILENIYEEIGELFPAVHSVL